MTQLRLCPICRRPLAGGEQGTRFRPFCSKRCADIDLGRWLKGGYAIPAADVEDKREAEAGGAEDSVEDPTLKPIRH